MIKTFCFKLYDSNRNKKLIRLIDIAGLIYNHCIALHKRYYRLYGRYIHKYQLQKHITKLKRTKKFAYFGKLDAQAIANITDRIDNAYHLFWENIKRKIKSSSPSFKRVRKYKSFTLRQNGWKLNETEKTITIQKTKYRYIWTRNIEGKIKRVTIKRDTLGSIYIYLCCDNGVQEVMPRTGKIVGYDFGLKKFLTASDGNDIESPEFFRRNSRIIKQKSRAFSRKKAGSKRRKRARIELAKIHRHTANQRRDFNHKTARKICNEYAVVCLENLNIQGMIKLWGRKINDLCFSSFLRILKYHAAKNGTSIVEIERYYPSSQICSSCGYRNAEVKNLQIRRWVCPECGTEHDRDRNAAKNILRAGASVHAGEPVRHPLERAQVC